MRKMKAISSTALAAIFMLTCVFTNVSFAQNDTASAAVKSNVPSVSSTDNPISKKREEKIRKSEDKNNTHEESIKRNKKELRSLHNVQMEIINKYRESIKNKLKMMNEIKKQTSAEAEIKKIEEEIQAIKAAFKDEINKYKDDFKKKKDEVKIKLKDGELEVEIEEEEELSTEIENSTSVGRSVYGEPNRDGLRKIIVKLEQGLEKAGEKDLTKLAIAYKSIGEYEKAIQTANRILEKNPTSQKALIVMAQAYRGMKQYDKAIDTVKEIMSKYPHAKIKAFLAILYKESGKLEDAKEALETSIEQSHKTKEFYKELGNLYSRLGKEGFKVFVKGRRPVFDVEPIARNGRVLVPLRAIVEALGAEVNYDPADRSITIKKGDINIVMLIGVNKATVNGKEVILEVAPVIINERTLVPVRFLSENLKTSVEYDNDTKMIIIDDENSITAEDEDILENQDELLDDEN